MPALPPDYDSDPGRRAAWKAPLDVHDTIGPELGGPVLDVGCGEGRLVARLRPGVEWFGVDSSEKQLDGCTGRPVVLGDMRALPFRSGAFAEVAQLWCLYHLEDPVPAIAEARRVLRPDGRYYASTAARDNDPEIMWEGYSPTSFDAEEAADIVGGVFGEVEAERWDGQFFSLQTRDEVRSYCRHNFIPEERSELTELPLWLTKRGVIVRASKGR